MTFSNWYSMRLYELLSVYKDTGFWTVDIGEYRKLMDCEDKYKNKKDGSYNDSDLIKYTITNAIIELEKTDCAFTVEAIKEGKRPIGAKGRKAFVQLEFRLKKVEQKTVPTAWKTEPKNQKVFEKMHMKYKISEVNLIKYFDVIGAKEVVDLLKTWDLKEVSGTPIENKLAYCNKVFVAMGKKAIENKPV